MEQKRTTESYGSRFFVFTLAQRVYRIRAVREYIECERSEHISNRGTPRYIDVDILAFLRGLSAFLQKKLGKKPNVGMGK